MDQRDWDAIQKKEKEILLYTSAEELVGNLLEDPNLREVTANELALFADRVCNHFFVLSRSVFFFSSRQFCFRITNCI